MNRMVSVPHVGPRCSYCGVKREDAAEFGLGAHSPRCVVVKIGADPMWGEWPADIKAERDALRKALNRLATPESEES